MDFTLNDSGGKIKVSGRPKLYCKAQTVAEMLEANICNMA
jgi:hypothetical protein